MDNRHTTTKMWKGLRLLWKMKIQSTVFFRKERPATFWPDPFLSLKRCGLKNQQTERRLERHRGSWMCGCTLKIFLSDRDAGVRGLNRRIKSKALFGQASTKTVTGQVISKVISPEVMSPEMLSYLAQNVIMPSRATSLTSPWLHIYSIVSSHESLRNMI